MLIESKNLDMEVVRYVIEINYYKVVFLIVFNLIENENFINFFCIY